MSNNNQSPKYKGVIANIVYSVLIFFALSSIGLAISNPAVLGGTADTSHIGSGEFLAVGVSILLTIVFSMWFAKRSSRQH